VQHGTRYDSNDGWTIAKTAGEITKKLYEIAKSLKDREVMSEVLCEGDCRTYEPNKRRLRRSFALVSGLQQSNLCRLV
jgi:hypothetical protein